MANRAHYLFDKSFIKPATVATVGQLLTIGFSWGRWTVEEINAITATSNDDRYNPVDGELVKAAGDPAANVRVSTGASDAKIEIASRFIAISPAGRPRYADRDGGSVLAAKVDASRCNFGSIRKLIVEISSRA